MVVDLLSAGFPPLPAEDRAGDGVLERARAYAENALGIRREDVDVFEVNPLGGNGAGQRHVAIRINRSDFSLTALEALLAEKRALSDSLAKVSGALASLQTSVKEQFAAAAESRAGIKAQEDATKRWRSRAEEVERENATLREQLRRSDALRAQGQQSLEALRAEFEALTRDLAQEGWVGAASGSRR